MIGAFKNFEDCKSELIAQGFKFSHLAKDGNKWFTNESKMDIAEIYIYTDNSVSVLIGKYTKKQDND